LAVAAVVLLVSAGTVVALGRPIATLGLLPRAIEIAMRSLRGVRETRAVVVGAREAAELAAAVAVVAVVVA
jgi:hypothetical protein